MSESPDPLGIGVIGVGLQGSSHARNVGADPRARLVALCDLNDALLARWGEELNVEHCFRNVQDLLACPGVEAVIIALPDHLHRDPAILALEAKKHVLLEKPMATTIRDALAIADAARGAPGRFMLNLSNRWMPVFAAAKEQIDSGVFGPVRYVFARMANRIDLPTTKLPWLQKSHLAHWGGIHRLDIARWYIGRPAVRVRAVQRKGLLAQQGLDTADFYQATIEFEGGAVMNLEGNWILPSSYPSVIDSRFYCLCDRGAVDIDRFRSEMARAGPEGFDLSTPLAGTFLGRPAGFTVEALRHFVDCCLDGTEPLVGCEDGLALTRILCAIERSCEQDGETVDPRTLES